MKRAGAVLTAAVLTAAVLPLTAFPVSAKTAVKAAYSFDKLAKGEVTAADIGANQYVFRHRWRAGTVTAGRL